MKMTAVLSTDSDTVTVTFEQDDAVATVEMTKQEFIDKVNGK